MIGKFVIVRTYSAGVHCGVLNWISLDGRQVHLGEARRIWRWAGANTLNEISLGGIDFEYSRISEPVDEISLMEAIEIIPCMLDAELNLKRSRWGK